MNQSILELRERFDGAIAAAASVKELDNLKVEYLGKKGSSTALLKNMGKLSVEEKKTFG
ncbi:MAG: phenylalanine--tRNA ligase subunit alpha, partial [Clostridia bacterium]|nr:phenylalanine--tRNA ligase subunit alpha [Clostridia bacterium]